MKSRRVGVIVPAYNAERYVSDTLASIAAQSYGDWRAVVVDDGSTDATAGIVEEFAKRDNRVSLVRQANAGPSVARNAGIRNMGGAGATYLSFVDSDDILLPDAFSLLVETLDRRPDAVGAAGLAEDMDADGQPSGTDVHSSQQRRRRTFHGEPGPTRRRARLATAPRRIMAWQLGRLLLPDEDTTFDSLAMHCTIWPPATALVRAEFVIGVEGYDESLRYMEDWEFLLRLARHGPFAFIDRQLVWYRRRPGYDVERSWDASYHCAKQAVRYQVWASPLVSRSQRRILARAHRLYAASLVKHQLRRAVSDSLELRLGALRKDLARLRYALRLLVVLHPTKPSSKKLEVLA